MTMYQKAIFKILFYMLRALTRMDSKASKDKYDTMYAHEVGELQKELDNILGGIENE